MKKSRSVQSATKPAEPVEGTETIQEQEGHSLQSADLSPQRIMDGVSTRTKVLDSILASHNQLRHWGINE